MLKNISKQQQTFNDETLEAFPLKPRTRKGWAQEPLLLSTVKSLNWCNKAGSGKEEIKLSMFANSMIRVLANLTQNG